MVGGRWRGEKVRWTWTEFWFRNGGIEIWSFAYETYGVWSMERPSLRPRLCLCLCLCPFSPPSSSLSPPTRFQSTAFCLFPLSSLLLALQLSQESLLCFVRRLVLHCQSWVLVLDFRLLRFDFRCVYNAILIAIQTPDVIGCLAIFKL